MIGELTKELGKLEMEPKKEPPWWTSTYGDEEKSSLMFHGKGVTWEAPFVEEFDLLEYMQVQEGRQGLRRDEQRTTVLVEGQAYLQSKNHINRAWTQENVQTLKERENRILREGLTKNGRLAGKRTTRTVRKRWKKMGLSCLSERFAGGLAKARRVGTLRCWPRR